MATEAFPCAGFLRSASDGCNRGELLYAAIREDDAEKPFMAHLLRLARTEPVKLQRAVGGKSPVSV